MGSSMRTCAQCGTEFPRQGKRIVCGDACAKRRDLDKRMARKRENKRPSFRCRWCGKSVKDSTGEMPRPWNGGYCWTTDCALRASLTAANESVLAEGAPALFQSLDEAVRLVEKYEQMKRDDLDAYLSGVARRQEQQRAEQAQVLAEIREVVGVEFRHGSPTVPAGTETGLVALWEGYALSSAHADEWANRARERGSQVHPEVSGRWAELGEMESSPMGFGVRSEELPLRQLDGPPGELEKEANRLLSQAVR